MEESRSLLSRVTKLDAVTPLEKKNSENLSFTLLIPCSRNKSTGLYLTNVSAMK